MLLHHVSVIRQWPTGGCAWQSRRVGTCRLLDSLSPAREAHVVGPYTGTTASPWSEQYYPRRGAEIQCDHVPDGRVSAACDYCCTSCYLSPNMTSTVIAISTTGAGTAIRTTSTATGGTTTRISAIRLQHVRNAALTSSSGRVGCLQARGGACYRPGLSCTRLIAWMSCPV